MSYCAVLFVSLALGVDAFSVAMGIGLGGLHRREAFFFCGLVTVFHVVMPLTGLFLGTYLGYLVGPLATTAGALLLLAIGGNMIFESLREKSFPLGVVGRRQRDFFGLFFLAGSVSIDALTVGLGLGSLRVDLLLTVITMGLVAGLMTAVGFVFGEGLSRIIGEKAGLCGGLILVILGFKFLLG